MKLTPRTDEELLNLLPEGEYDFFVKQAEDTVSKKGNEMIRLSVAILDSNNREHLIFDYLLDALAFKVKHFAEAVGLEDKYNAGCYMASDCWNKSGRCYVTRVEAKDGFPAKNNVADYIKASDVKAAQPAGSPLIDDQDIPF